MTEKAPVIVDAALAGARLDATVKKAFALSWNDARRYIESGKVFIGEARMTNGARIVKEGDAIALRMNVPKPLAFTDLRKEQIVHLDDDLIVLDKPPGLLAIPFEGEKDTLQSRAQTYLARVEKVKKAETLGVVHRIDKDTSGLIVFTRTFSAKTALAEQFRLHTATRAYLAIVHGDAQGGTVKSSLVGDRGDGLRGSWEQTAMAKRGEKRPREAQKAVTHFSVKERLRGATLLECRLETGRTHQIRIHASEAGHPILGEHVYVREFRGKPLFAPRLMLHAFGLGFLHPRTRKAVSFERGPPQDFEAVAARLREARSDAP
ncbi:MAG: RluA family pseudouridine synthase [Deltaproteobacteria bacterium]|nr:RluA family pseudouridine synthase [Deltaproteobacteria bacterium]